MSGTGVAPESLAANDNGNIGNASGTSNSSGVMQLANNARTNFSPLKVFMMLGTLVGRSLSLQAIHPSLASG